MIKSLAVSAIAFTISAATFFVAYINKAHADPITITTTPPTIYLFVVITPAAAGKVPWTEIAHTFDKATCDAQLAAWTPLVGTAKLACLPLDNVGMLTTYNGG
jgi:hypothetical protein